MRTTFTFTFDECPLIIDRGFECGLVAGEAEIAYYDDGADWHIESISLDGSKRNRWSFEDLIKHAELAKQGKPLPPSFERRQVALDEASPIFLALYERLENEWRDTVVDAIRQDMEERRAEAAETRAEYRRDDRMGA